MDKTLQQSSFWHEPNIHGLNHAEAPLPFGAQSKRMRCRLSWLAPMIGQRLCSRGYDDTHRRTCHVPCGGRRNCPSPSTGIARATEAPVQVMIVGVVHMANTRT